ncbi:MAG TPA: hypothetical protein VNG69_06990 [Casimicrobiaceae bacterium]|nr:hypothetical protein [Casimicrobiaceae bacterium]
MNSAVLIGCFVSAAMIGSAIAARSESPHAGEESRPIKALSTDDVEAYLAGKGMGLAKAAELNGYPGPLHVLALSSELALTADQKQRTESLFAAMESKAIAAGRRLVDEERKLDRLFASKTIDRRSLERSLKRIGELQAEVRRVHLETHLAQIRILSPAQVSSYMALRGYSNPMRTEGHFGHKH